MESTKMSQGFLAAMGAAGALSVAGVGISGQSHRRLPQTLTSQRRQQATASRWKLRSTRKPETST